jgi:signal transduction histidine kinase
MMSLGDVRRVELWMTYVRWFAFLFGVVTISIQPTYPSAGVERMAWSLVVFLGLGNLVIWGAIDRIKADRNVRRLGIASFAFDAFIVFAIVWVFAYETPYVTWALLFVLPLEGALRFRLVGALAAAAAIAVVFIPQSSRVATLHHESFDLGTYVFVVGLGTLIAALSGAMAEAWHGQHLAFMKQSLRLAEVDRLKDRFLAVTSHEIRGPLAAIIAGVDTVQKRGERLDSEQRQRLLEMVSSQGHQLARLVDDLLLTSEIQERQLALHPQWEELKETIDQAVQAAATKRRAHQLQMFVEPLRCLVDGARVAQILRNLVENAYKYTPERTRVAVAGKAVTGGIMIEVSDDGPGIPAEHRDELFDAFRRNDQTTAGQDGIGLGLFVVSQLVTAMEGHIDLESSVNGTTFTIYLPCRTMTERRLEFLEDEGKSATG